MGGGGEIGHGCIATNKQSHAPFCKERKEEHGRVVVIVVNDGGRVEQNIQSLWSFKIRMTPQYFSNVMCAGI